MPRLLATNREWFDYSFDYDGPACYELGTGGPRGGNIQWHYVGETNNELARLICYARSGSHLSAVIDWHLQQGWCLYYRACAADSKAQAKKMQDSLLSRFYYDWNVALNR
jgi:hypothetical protein